MITELLKKTLPLYEIKLPVSKKTVRFRPMTVKEEKVLLLGQKSNSSREKALAMEQILSSCFEGLDSVKTLPIADVEKAFLSLRSKSIGEDVVFSLVCPATKETVNIKLNLEEFELQENKNQKSSIKLSDDMVLMLEYPSFSYMLDEKDAKKDEIKSIFKNCFVELQTTQNVFVKNEISDDELSSFYDLMTSKQLEEFKKFVSSIPRMKKTVTYTTKDGVERKVTLTGIESFFAYASAT